MTKKKYRNSLILLVLLVVISLISACSKASVGQGTENTAGKTGEKSAEKKAENMTPSEIYMYQGADREKILIENAKKEGTFTLYTSINMDDLKVFVDAFEKKYGIKVNHWRAHVDDIVQRIVNEAKGKRNEFDVTEMNGPQLEMLAREKLVSQFYSPYLKDLPANAIPDHKLWVAERFNFIVMAYNTNKVKPEDVPQKIEDFLDPKWKGKIGIETSAVEWFATIVKIMGEEKGFGFYKKLMNNNAMIYKGYELIGQNVASGEIPIGMTAYNHTVERLKSAGAPIEWKPIQPVVGRPNGLALSKNAPHPYAALLFAEFMISPEGQELIKSLNRVPSSTKIKTTLNNFEYKMEDPVVTLDEWEKWNGKWDEIIIKRK